MDLKEDGPDVSLFFSTLHTTLGLKDVEQARKVVKDFLATVDDPQTVLLDLLEGCNISKGKGNSLANFIANETQKWLLEHPECQLSGLSLRKAQNRVFPLVTEGQLLDVLISIYRLQEADRSFLLGPVRHLYQTGKYREAAILSTRLNLQPDLDLEQMCTPLLLMERFNLVESYVSGYPELQTKLLQMLDRWSLSRFNPRKLSREFKGLPPVKTDKLNPKTITKLAFRLLDLYKLDPAVCSNIINQRHMGTLKYLMHKRFVEKTMTEENWSDHVQNIVAGNGWLQEQCISLLFRYCDRQTAGCWALKFGLPKEKLPRDLVDILRDFSIHEQLSEKEKNTEDSSQVRKNHFYQLPIPRSKVHFLQSHTALPHCRDIFLQDGQVVGVDMEWRPSFGGLGKPNVSLIQIAVKGEVFMLDLLQGDLLQSGNTEEEDVPQLVIFIKELFSCPTVTKLGYGMLGDFQCLDATHAAFGRMELCNVVDLCEVHKQIQSCRSQVRTPGGPVEVLEERSSDEGFRQPEKGLSLLVKDVLGKPLDKTQQLSNWDKRPLREDQITYAAADAYCLLEVFEALINIPEKFGLKQDFYKMPKGKPQPLPKMDRSPQKKEKTPPKQKPKTLTKETKSNPSSKPLSPKQFSVICDNMLQGLGRYLRCLGVDVLMLDNDDDHRRAAEIARQDGRVILTCGLPYQTLRSQIGEGRCFYVDCSEKARQQAIKVLKHFNIHVTLSDVFSRCQVCNCDKYLHISQEQMIQLMKLQEHLEDSQENSHKQPDSQSEGTDSSQDLEWMKDLGLSLTLPSGAQMQLNSVPTGIVEKVSLFFCCSHCGKIFWEGSHFGRVVSQFKEVLHDHGDHFYQSASKSLSMD